MIQSSTCVIGNLVSEAIQITGKKLGDHNKSYEHFSVSFVNYFQTISFLKKLDDHLLKIKPYYIVSHIILLHILKIPPF